MNGHKISENKMADKLGMRISLKNKLNWDRWAVFALLISALVLLPIATIVWLAFFVPESPIWLFEKRNF